MALAATDLESGVRQISHCRSCGSADLEEVLNLGSIYVSGFPEAQGEGHRAPLVVVQCQNCTLAQLQHTVPSAWHYEGGYWYRSGTNEQMVVQLQDIANDVLSRVTLNPQDLVVDIGSNDGTLLRMFPDRPLRIGFEPDHRLAVAAKAVDRTGVYMNQFFPPLRRDPGSTETFQIATVITAIAMFYDLDDPNEFLVAIKDWLAPGGLFVIQMAYAPAMLRTNDIGNIAHEHLEYYTVKSLAHLLNRHGLMIEDVTFNDVNGGSFRVFVRHGTGGIQNDPPRAKLNWREFAFRVAENRQDTKDHLSLLRDIGKRIIGYGASTRGNTVLQHYGIGPDLLPAIADRNPAKWGRCTVGSNIPIISEEEMRARKPDNLFVLPWHLIASFKRREPDYVGRFIVPLPRLHIE